MPSEKLSIDQPAEAIDTAEARMRLALGLTGAGRPSSAGQGGSPQNHGPQQGPSHAHDASRPQRRRFAQDGDVPVVMLSRGRDADTNGESRIHALSTELREERSGRAKAERALDEANLSIQSLKTKLAHAEIAFEERLREEREARGKVETLRITDQTTRQSAETREAEATLALSLLERRLGEMEAEIAAAKAAIPLAAPKIDLFSEVEAEAPARKTRVVRRSAAAPDPEPEAELEIKRAVVKRGPKKAAAVTEGGTTGDDQPIEWWLPSFRAARTTGGERKRKTR